MGVPLLDTGTWLAPDPRPGSEETERENHNRERGVLDLDERGKEVERQCEAGKKSGSGLLNDRAQKETGSVGPLPPCSRER